MKTPPRACAKILNAAQSARRVALIEKTAITHHGLVGVALHAAGARTEVFRPWRDGALPGLGDHDGPVVFGGEQNALSDARHPDLPALSRLMADSGASGRAVLGVCLGAQIMARRLGAEIHRGTAAEFGWAEVGLLPQAATVPVLRHLATAFPIFEWHSDTHPATLPPGSTHIATGPVAHIQCYRTHRAAYGMQFPVVANRAVVADWTATYPDAFESGAPGWLANWPTRALTAGAAADQHGLTIAREWEKLI